MDVTIVAVGLAVAVAILGAAAFSRGRLIGALRGLTGAADDASLIRSVREQRDRIAGAEHDALQASRDLDYLVELVGVGIVHLSDDLLVDAANTAAHRFLGRAPGTMKDRPALEAFVDARVEAVVEAAVDGGVQSGEIVTADADGATLLVRARRSPGGIWVVLEDVSELRRLQRIRAEFIDNLSHELRTPLTTVSLLAETLIRDAESAGDSVPQRMRDRIGKIEVETGHLVQMVNELLDLTRIESGRSLVLVDDVDMNALSVAAVERLHLFAERQGVPLSVDVPGEVPPVRGASDRLEQVLINLVHNAVKFSPNGGLVTIRVREDGDEVVTEVVDHGIGIPRASLGRVFERFYKVDRARVRSGGGTGLGLSIARHVIAQHGGRIWVESREGYGSTFSFALPVAGRAVDDEGSPVHDPGPDLPPSTDEPIPVTHADA